jgi:hypothetical protein
MLVSGGKRKSRRSMKKAAGISKRRYGKGVSGGAKKSKKMAKKPTKAAKSKKGKKSRR